MEVGHIVPRSRPEVFEALYPGLDIDNVVNLHLITKNVNRRNGNSVILSPLAIHNAISYSARVVGSRLPKLLRSTITQDDYEWVLDELDNLPQCVSFKLEKPIVGIRVIDEMLLQKKPAMLV
jgi:hypothetical protein